MTPMRVTTHPRRMPRARRIGVQMELALDEQILTSLITAACKGGLDGPLFNRLFWNQRSEGPRPGRLMDRLKKRGRFTLPPWPRGAHRRAQDHRTRRDFATYAETEVRHRRKVIKPKCRTTRLAGRSD